MSVIGQRVPTTLRQNYRLISLIADVPGIIIAMPGLYAGQNEVYVFLDGIDVTGTVAGWSPVTHLFGSRAAADAAYGVPLPTRPGEELGSHQPGNAFSTSGGPASASDVASRDPATVMASAAVSAPGDTPYYDSIAAVPAPAPAISTTAEFESRFDPDAFGSAVLWQAPAAARSRDSGSRGGNGRSRTSVASASTSTTDYAGTPTAQDAHSYASRGGGAAAASFGVVLQPTTTQAPPPKHVPMVQPQLPPSRSEPPALLRFYIQPPLASSTMKETDTRLAQAAPRALQGSLGDWVRSVLNREKVLLGRATSSVNCCTYLQ
jgi:hypothetical protein